MNKVFIVKTFNNEFLFLYEVGLFASYNDALNYVNKIKKRNHPYFIYEFDVDECGKLTFIKCYIILNKKIKEEIWYNQENINSERR